MRQRISSIRPSTRMQLLDRLWSFWYSSLKTQTKSDFLLKKPYWLNVTSPSWKKPSGHFRQNFLNETFVDRFRPCRHVVINIETDKRCIVVELCQFLSIYYWFVRIFNSSDDALLVRAKRQKPQEKHGSVNRTRIQSLLIKMTYIIQIYDRNFSKFSDTFS